MHYNFPVIRHIDEVRRVVENRREYIIVDKGDYIVVNYVISSPCTFPPVVDEMTSILRECRGLVFYPNGDIMSRPFHKFFNIDEKPETAVDNVDMSLSHIVLQKLDGSMIRPLFIKGALKWGTKMGTTDVAVFAETFAQSHPNYAELAWYCKDHHLSPIFEYCSRENKIVIDYPQKRMVLTAIRHNFTGEYFIYDDMCVLAATYGIEVVACRCLASADLVDFMSEVKAEGENEGYVVRFASGHMLKVKTEWYLGLHRGKAAIECEKGVIALILEEKADDVKPTLSVQDLQRFEDFETSLINGLHVSKDNLFLLHQQCKDLDRKEIALGPATKLDKSTRTLLFGLLKSDTSTVTLESIWKVVVAYVLSNIGSNKKVEEIRHLWGGARWSSTLDVEEK
jgi:RNA ligase